MVHIINDGIRSFYSVGCGYHTGKLFLIHIMAFHTYMCVAVFSFTQGAL